MYCCKTTNLNQTSTAVFLCLNADRRSVVQHRWCRPKTKINKIQDGPIKYTNILPTAKVSEQVNRKYPSRITTAQLQPPTPTLNPQTLHPQNFHIVQSAISAIAGLLVTNILLSDDSERILKIGQHMIKQDKKLCGFLLFSTTLYMPV